MMKIGSYLEASPKSYGEPAKAAVGRVAIGKDDGAKNFCMRVFELGKDGFTPRHSHEWEHEIFFHKGKGQVLRNGEWRDVSSGDIAFIPGGEDHQIRNIGNGDLIFVCLIPAGYPEL